MKRSRLFLVLALLVCSCSSQIVNVPVNPYVDPGIRQKQIRRVAVLPFVVPDYLQFQEGAEAVSIEVTNAFMANLAAQGVYDLVEGDTVRAAIKRQFATARDWIFQGTRTEAARVGHEVAADAVVFGVIKKYFQGNLTDSEVELEINLVEVTGRVTVWRVREILIGKGGKKYLNETPLAVPPGVLAEVAAKDAAHKVRRIHEAGGAIEVVSVSHRKAWGYGVLAGGLVFTAAGAYYYAEADAAYENYKNADNDADLERYRRSVKENDQAWQILGGLGVAAVGGGLYLLLTDHTVESYTAKGSPAPEPAFAVAPALLPGGAPGVALGVRF
ncbi:MAG: hypothetical protein M5R36_29220 [Deltaproteobacteria bacterium]|nr:hypothetical protein [Deltaproteobacteria bacterium]